MVKKLLSIFLTILFIVPVCSASPYKGFSSFAALNSKFPCSNFLKVSAYARKPAMVVLYGSFGDDWHCVERFIRRFSHRKHLLQIHIYNGSCLYLRRCYSGELFTSSTKKVNALLVNQDPIVIDRIRQRVIEISERVATLKAPKTKLILTTGLEDRLTSGAYKVMYSILRSEWPYDMARNPVGKTHKKFYPANYIELHGLPTKFSTTRCIWNGDGFNLTVPETRAAFDKFNQCKVLYAWTKQSQGIFGGPFVPPLERTFQLDLGVVKDYATVLKN